jgi:restriction system protein
MARRRQNYFDPNDPKTAVGLLMAIGVMWVVGQLLQQVSRVSGGDIGLVIFVGVAAALSYWVVRALQRENARRALFQKVQATIEQHRISLVRRRAQLVQPDAYGKPQRERWITEIQYFITHHIGPSLTSREYLVLGRERATIENFVERCVMAAMQDEPAFQAFSDDMTPSEFEVFCAEELRRVGWNARVTMQSRDQGVDVVAEKGGVRVVIQCKLYKQPVGNKAVQEAAAAKAHEQASYGIVVTNNRYTQAAEQLASTNGVLLLHYRDLQNLDNLLRPK